eukprot:758799-Hanusia_phi.AAC.3
MLIRKEACLVTARAAAGRIFGMDIAMDGMASGTRSPFKKGGGRGRYPLLSHQVPPFLPPGSNMKYHPPSLSEVTLPSQPDCEGSRFTPPSGYSSYP